MRDLNATEVAKRQPYYESRETMGATTKLVEIENRNAFILINGWMPLKVLREFMGKTRGQFGHPFYAIVDKESNRELVHRRHDSKIHINLT